MICLVLYQLIGSQSETADHGKFCDNRLLVNFKVATLAYENQLI